MNPESTAVKSLLNNVSLLTGHVFTPDEDAGRDTYVLVFPSGPEVMDDQRWSTTPVPASDAQFSVPIRAVSQDVIGIGLIAEAVRGLVGTKPTVAGRKCDPVTVEFDPVKKDNSVSPALFFMDMWVEFWSRRS